MALLAALAPGAFAQGVAHSRLRVTDEITRPDLAGGVLVYRSPGPRGDDLKALDLETGTRVLMYDTGSASMSIEAVRAVPGLVAIGLRAKTGRDGLATGVLAFAAAAPGARFVTASGFTKSDGDGGAGCGGVLTLEDLAPDGTILTEEAIDPCRRARARASVIRGYGLDGQPREIWRLGVTGALRVLENRKRVSLVGSRLLIWSLASARLVSLPSGSSRVALPSAPRTVLYQADANPAGRLVAAELTLRRSRTAARVRSVARSAPRGGTVLSVSHARLPDARFCGDSLVVWSLGPDGRQRVTATRPGLPAARYRGGARVPEGRIRGFACDSRTYAVISDTGRRRATLDLFRLP